MKKTFYYTVFLKDSDDVVAAGTAKECAKKMSKSLNGFFSMVSKNTLGIQNKYEIVKEKVSVDDIENIWKL